MSTYYVKHNNMFNILNIMLLNILNKNFLKHKNILIFCLHQSVRWQKTNEMTRRKYEDIDDTVFE